MDTHSLTYKNGGEKETENEKTEQTEFDYKFFVILSIIKRRETMKHTKHCNDTHDGHILYDDGNGVDIYRVMRVYTE